MISSVTITPPRTTPLTSESPRLRQAARASASEIRVDRFERPTAKPEDTARTASKKPSPISAAICNGDVLEVAALVGEAKSPAEKRKLLETPNEHGLSPLLQAAMAKDPRVVAMLLHLGADATRVDPNGRNVLSIAAHLNDVPTLRFLLDKEEVRTAVQGPIWKTPEDVAKVVESLGNKANAKSLDKAAAKLLGVDKNTFVNAEHLQKYISHLYAFETNPLGVEAEGWNYPPFLAMRVRSLLAFAVKPEKLATVAKSKPEKVQEALINEISASLEALRTYRRIASLHNIENEELLSKVAKEEATAILARIDQLPQNFEYIVPAGWELHATYLNFMRRTVNGQDVLTVRQDNRGAGADRHRTRPGQRVSSGGTAEPLKVYPYAFNIPMTALQDPQVRDLLQQFIGDKLVLAEQDAEDIEDTLYDLYDALKAKLIFTFGPIVAMEASESFEPMHLQTTGNCVVANANAGVQARLGQELAQAIFSAEQHLAKKRLFKEALTPAALRAHIAANEERIKDALAEMAT